MNILVGECGTCGCRLDETTYVTLNQTIGTNEVVVQVKPCPVCYHKKYMEGYDDGKYNHLPKDREEHLE